MLSPRWEWLEKCSISTLKVFEEMFYRHVEDGWRNVLYSRWRWLKKCFMSTLRVVEKMFYFHVEGAKKCSISTFRVVEEMFYLHVEDGWKNVPSPRWVWLKICSVSTLRVVEEMFCLHVEGGWRNVLSPTTNKLHFVHFLSSHSKFCCRPASVGSLWLLQRNFTRAKT